MVPKSFCRLIISFNTLDKTYAIIIFHYYLHDKSVVEANLVSSCYSD